MALTLNVNEKSTSTNQAPLLKNTLNTFERLTLTMGLLRIGLISYKRELRILKTLPHLLYPSKAEIYQYYHYCNKKR